MSRGKITPEFKEKLKEAVNILDVVGEHVVLKKSGANHTGLCPFHNERSPSFSVHEQKQLYHCYGCQKGGDLVSFVMEIHGLSFPEAIEELAARANLALPKEWGGANDGEDPEVARRRNEARDKLATAHKLNRFVASYYHAQVGHQPHIAQYFRRRGVEGEMARGFYVGAAPPLWDGLSSHLAAKKAPLPLAEELGLIKRSPKERAGGPGYFDLFRNRAMFPIIDLRGKVVAFGGRGLPLPEGAPDVGGESPKYLNSAESFLFHKSKVAFGLYQAQKHIRAQNAVILVEGYFDVLALHAAGFQNAVATCGTSLTIDHLNLFRRLCDRVIVLFDGDRAGIAATDRAMELGLEQGQVLYGAHLPEGLDPDELLFDQDSGQPLAEGKERMTAILAASQPLIDRRVGDLAMEAVKGPEQQTQALKQVGAWLSRFQDPVGREVRLESAARALGVSRALLERAAQGEGGAARGKGMGNAPRSAPSEVRPPAGPPPYEGPDYGSGPDSGYGGGGGRGRRDPGGREKGGFSRQFDARRGEFRERRPAPWTTDGPGRRGPAARRARGRGPSPAERIVLFALARPEKYGPLLSEVRGKLPPEKTFFDLFEDALTRAWVEKIEASPEGWARLRQDPASWIGPEVDAQVRSILTEAVVAGDATYPETEVRLALGQGLARSWARFSQSIKAALAAAEAKKDAELQSKLLQDYLDVQRRMKEFTSFYDEA